MLSKICPKCGKEISEESRYCNNCGSKIEAVEKHSILEDNSNKIDKQESLKDNLPKTIEDNTSNIKKFEKIKIPKNKIGIIVLICTIISIFIFIGNSTDYTFSYAHWELKKYNTKDSNGNTYLMNYINQKNIIKAKELIAKGVNIDIVNNSGDNALMLATKTKNKDIVDLLISKKTNSDIIDYIDVPNKSQDTALLMAINNGDVAICQKLIDLGAYMDVYDKYQNTPLDLCIRNDNKKLLEMLITHGADINKVDKNKDTPLLLAVKLKKKDMIEPLIKKGADATIKDVNGDTVFNICSNLKDTDMFNLCILDNKDKVISMTIQQQENEGNATPSYDVVNIQIKKEQLYDFFMVNGQKTLTDTSGFVRYVGQITNGKITGFGIAYNGNGNKIDEDNQIIYQGNWKNGLWDGKGKSYWLKGFGNFAIAGEKNTVLYDTTYQNGYRTGQYTRYFSDGALNDTGTSSNGNNNSEKYGQSSTPIKSEPTIGMTAEQVRNSTWGNPQSINKTTTANGTSEQWVYSGYRYIYLDGGIVTAIQD